MTSQSLKCHCLCNEETCVSVAACQGSHVVQHWGLPGPWDQPSPEGPQSGLYHCPGFPSLFPNWCPSILTGSQLLPPGSSLSRLVFSPTVGWDCQPDPFPVFASQAPGPVVPWTLTVDCSVFIRHRPVPEMCVSPIRLHLHFWSLRAP